MVTTLHPQLERQWIPNEANCGGCPALMAIAGILFMAVAAMSGNAGVWVALGIVFLIIAGISFRRWRATK